MSCHNFLLRFFFLFWTELWGRALAPWAGVCVSKSNTLTCTSKLILDVSGRSYFSVKQNSVSQTAQKHTNILLTLKEDFFRGGVVRKEKRKRG